MARNVQMAEEPRGARCVVPPMNLRSLGGAVLVFAGVTACAQTPVGGVEPRAANEFRASDVDPLERIAGWRVVLDAQALDAWDASSGSVGVVDAWITLPAEPLALREPLSDFEARVMGRRDWRDACAPAYLRAVADVVWFRDALDSEDRRVELVNGTAAIGPFVVERSEDPLRPWRLALRSIDDFETVQQVALREWDREIGVRVATFAATNTTEWRAVEGAHASIEGDELVLEGRAGAKLVTTREWGDYRFECEFALPDRGDCGILLRSDAPSNMPSVSVSFRETRPVSAGQDATLAWHALRVEQVGPWGRAWIDGECVFDEHLSAPSSGWFGFALPSPVPTRLRIRNLELHDLGTQTWRELELTELPQAPGDERFAVACNELLPNATLRIDAPGNMRDFVCVIRVAEGDHEWLKAPDPALSPRDQWTAVFGHFVRDLGPASELARPHVVVTGAHGGREFLFVDGFEKMDMRNYSNQSGCNPDGNVYVLGADRAALADVRAFVLSGTAR